MDRPTGAARVLTFGAPRHRQGRDDGDGLCSVPASGAGCCRCSASVTAAAVFAAVLSRTLTGVVDEAKVSDDVVNEALANGDDQGEKVPVKPATVTGKVVSASDRSGIAGRPGELFRAATRRWRSPRRPPATTGAFDSGRSAAAATTCVKFSGARLRRDGGIPRPPS